MKQSALIDAVRTRLDESDSEGFIKTAEIINLLNQAHIDIFNFLLATFHAKFEKNPDTAKYPEAFKTQFMIAVGKLTQINLANAFYLIGVYEDAPEGRLKINQYAYKGNYANLFLAIDSIDRVYTYDNGTLTIQPNDPNLDVEIIYLKNPDEITAAGAAATEYKYPTLLSAAVQFTYAKCLLKDNRVNDSVAAMAEYNNLLNQLYY